MSKGRNAKACPYEVINFIYKLRVLEPGDFAMNMLTSQNSFLKHVYKFKACSCQSEDINWAQKPSRVTKMY
jgi:hypothetical protein